MSKSIAKQYHETRAAAQRCKPRSERRTKLQERLAGLMLRQLRIENRKRRAA